MFDLEPFADKISSPDGALNPSQYRIGYRFPATRAIFTQIEIPAEVIERAVLSKLLVVPRMTSDGTVTADIPVQGDLTSNDPLEVAPVPIHELVVRAMAPENLRLEEAKISDLRTLLDLLEQSISKVRTAVAMAAKRA